MTAARSPFSSSPQSAVWLASEVPLVTSTFSAEAPGYSAAMRSRRRTDPSDSGYFSAVDRSPAESNPSPRSSSTRIGWTPLSERLYRTAFS